MPEPASGESLPDGAGGTVGGEAAGADVEFGDDGLRKYTPGPVFATLKWVSWIELGLFAGLMFLWLGPVHSDQWIFIFGMSHGIGFLILCAVVMFAVMRREAPYWLLAATLTPVGPVGSVIGIEAIERRRRPDS